MVKNGVRPLVEDLDSLPFLDRELFYERDAYSRLKSIKGFSVQRGCPFRCSYCFIDGYRTLYKGKGTIVRARSVGALLDEIEEVRSRYPLKFLRFDDNVLLGNDEWLGEFADRYRSRIGLPFNCCVHPHLVTAERCRLLRKAGCASVLIGIESGNEHIRRSLLRRHMPNEKMIEACRMLKGVGLRICSSNMVGLPGESLDQAFETVTLNQQCKVDYAWVALFQPYPRTALGDRCVEHGLFGGDYEKLDYTLHGSSPLRYDDPREKAKMENLHRIFALLVQFPLLGAAARVLIALPKNGFFSLLYKLWFGYALKNRVYPCKISLREAFWGAKKFFWYKSTE